MGAARRLLAEQQGQILVEQGRVQEKAKQDAITASLEKQATDAQYAVIETRKKNELLSSNCDLEIARINEAIAEQNAKAALAPRTAEAAIYQANPVYAQVIQTQAVAAAYKNTDKVMMLPNGVSPIILLGDSGHTPQVTIPAR